MNAEIKRSLSTENSNNKKRVVKPLYQPESFEEKLRKSLLKYTNEKNRALKKDQYGRSYKPSIENMTCTDLPVDRINRMV
jgi:hypothetical protein